MFISQVYLQKCYILSDTLTLALLWENGEQHYDKH